MSRQLGLTVICMVFAVSVMWSCGGDEANENKAEQSGLDKGVSGAKVTANKYIIFFGNSLTAGYGIEPGEAFPALIQKRLDSLGLNYTVINAGLSGETTASGVNRVEWVISQQPVDIFVLELGGNDGLRGIEVTETRKNLLAIIEKVRVSHPKAQIILAGMMVPPNMGSKYSSAFKSVFPAVAKEANVKLIPFILEHVGGEKELNQADGIHPTPEGHTLVRENVWKVLKESVDLQSNTQ